MVVIGGGAIGVELASVWSRFGSSVTLIEYMDTLLPAMGDKDISAVMKKVLQTSGIRLHLGTCVVSGSSDGHSASIEVVHSGGNKERIEADIVLVAVGRVPFTRGLGLERIGVETKKNGCIDVDGYKVNGTESVWAIGDVIEGPMLAHRAMEDGALAADAIAGISGSPPQPNTIPSVVYTYPEAATLGPSDAQLDRLGIPYCRSVYPLSANGRARTSFEHRGFVKLLARADQPNLPLLGASIVAPNAGDMIHEISVAIKGGMGARELGQAIHTHPSISEAIKDCAMDICGEGLH
eukprot:GHVO01068639.1.p1 GENE.GHVO01068639.1~~GHVO01068639.1.p1  ORF type:complete len:294 (+),score=55.90 GHVO01068639.1:793-1674(+)